ncbi:MAG: GTP 3',8-cyclase MoaA [Firmicutes bacterium]|nr:GTP 3',8-cyclase MoaA [Bacillota bacterium]
MKDKFGREIGYLRVAVTDRCNLRCLYCMPEEGVEFKPHPEILTYEEIERVIRAAVPLGITKIRLTGGEPLVRKDLPDFIKKIRSIPGIEEIALTTNGTFLPKYAYALKEAGLDRVNISLDSLKPERYKEMTRGGDLSKVLRGINLALDLGLKPVKLNVVVVKGFNDDEVLDFVAFVREKEVHVRFIEFMSIGESRTWKNRGYVENAQLRERISLKDQTLTALSAEEVSVLGNGPAEYYRVQGGLGTIGFISPVSNHFCSRCNRLRLTADGKLRPCLLSDRYVDIKTALRSGGSQKTLQDLIKKTIFSKPEEKEIDQTKPEDEIGPDTAFMSQIGG